MPADLDALLAGLFAIAGGADWERWLDALRGAFHATAAVLVPLAAAGASPRAAGEAALPEFGPWIAALRGAPAGDVPDVTTLGPAAGRGGARGLGTVLATGPSRFALVVARDHAAGAFTAAQIAAFRRVAGFARQALAMRRTVVATEAEVEALRQVLDQSRRGFVVIDDGGRVAFANAFASELLAAGGVIRTRAGALTARNRADERPLREAIEEARRDHRKQAVVTLHGPGAGVEFVATVRALPPKPADGEFGPAPRLTVIRVARAVPERTAMAPGHLESVFAFTPKEARVASLLVAGLDLSEVAVELSITTGTTRHHLKAIFAKTGVHRQRDLVHLLRIALPSEAAMRGN